MTESEYITLSMAIRDILPIQRILHDINVHSFISLFPRQADIKSPHTSLPPR
jgi:hypothetical protein